MYVQMISSRERQPHVSSLSGATSWRGTAVSVRRAAKNDAATIARIGRYGFAKTHRLAFHKPDLALYLAKVFSEGQILAEMAQPKALFLVAEVAGEVVGTLRLAHESPTSVQLTDAVQLSRLYLHPDAIGQGVGSALMLHALSTAVASGRKHGWLGVWQGNGRAINFYDRWGFESVGTDVILIGQSCPVGLIMARSLS